MKRGALVLLVCVSAACSYAQTTTRTISSDQLQAVLDLPLDQAVKLREAHKKPLKDSYTRQVSLVGKDCQSDHEQAQQPYNVCMAQASEKADQDFAVFYNELQMLCHDQQQLTTMHGLEATWQMYKDGAMKAAHAAWPNGTGASGFTSQIHLSLVRNHMRQLYEIYGLNIAQ